MNKCKRCGVSIADNTKICPLCDMVLTGENEPCEANYPDVRHKTRFLRRLINIITYFLIVLEIVLIVINYYNYFGVEWSIISGGIIVYLIITLQYTVNKRNGHIKKIFVQMVGALVLTILIDVALGYSGWSLNIGIPCIIFVLDTIIVICMIINNEYWQNYLLMQVFTVLLSIVQMILYFTHIVDGPVLPWTSFGVSAILFTSSVVIGDKQARNELKKRFYI